MTSAGAAGPSTDADEARQVRDLDAALQNPDFTSVFAPADLDRAQERKKMARQAGVEPVILTEHLTKIYPAQPNKPALDDVNIEESIPKSPRLPGRSLRLSSKTRC